MLSILTTLLSLLITLSIANCSFHWVFSYLSSVSVISAFFDPENWLFLGKKKKHRFALFGRIMKFFFWSNHSAVSPLIWSTHPLLAWGGHQKALFSVFLVVNILKFDINCTFFWDYFQLTKPKTKSKTLGLCPKPHSHLRGRRGMWQNLSTFPWAECWVDSRRQG